MNGESLPKGKREADVCLMGTMVVRGEAHGTVFATGSNTELGTTAALLKQVWIRWIYVIWFGIDGYFSDDFFGGLAFDWLPGKREFWAQKSFPDLNLEP